MAKKRERIAVLFVCLFFSSGTDSNEPHSVGRCAKWVAWGKEHQETIKFGGLSASRGSDWFGLHWN